MSKKKDAPSPTIITLTLPEPDSEGTLLIQRGELAHMSQFAHTSETDFNAVIQQAVAALTVVEDDPPVIPEAPPRKTMSKTVSPPEPSEPMLNIPTKTKKGTTAIPARCLQIIGGETDETAQGQALKVAGRLLDSGLWDGKVVIGIDDSSAVLRRLDGLTDKELKVLFKLEQFVQVNPHDETDAASDNSAESKDAQAASEDLSASDN